MTCPICESGEFYLERTILHTQEVSYGDNSIFCTKEYYCANCDDLLSLEETIDIEVMEN